jgi:tetratricopeptide (TPR) repeat protein
MNVIPKLICATLMAALSAGALGAGGGGPVGGSDSMPSGRQLTPQEEAQMAYRDGTRAVKQADKLDKAVDEAKDAAKRDKALARARKQYDKARVSFVMAVQRVPNMHEAWNYIGYTSRKLGEYDKALAAYEEALRLKPGYVEAIEYRGEAFLGLGRVDDAKTAYLTLFSQSRELADQLMGSMRKWVEQQRATQTSSAAPDQLDAFARWIEERSTLAQQTTAFAAPDVGARTDW